MLEPEEVAKPAENERETAIKRAAFTVVGLNDKEACGGLTPDLMSKAGATVSKHFELNITNVDTFFERGHRGDRKLRVFLQGHAAVLGRMGAVRTSCPRGQTPAVLRVHGGKGSFGHASDS